MTIRLKLTLIYSLILTLVVLVFSFVLYTWQNRTTLETAAQNLTRIYSIYTNPDRPPPNSIRSFPLDEQRDRFNQPLVQFQDFNELIVYSSESLGSVVLPLSVAGHKAVRQGEVWFERASIDDEWFLIRSQHNDHLQPEPLIIQTALPVDNQIEYLEQLRNFLIIGDILIVVAALGIGWVVAGVTLRPIDRITNTARIVGEERDFGRRVPHPGPNDEIGQLATTFNKMLAQLQAAYIQIEETLRAQRRFVADASHELRTPLTTIRGNLELLWHTPTFDDNERVDILSDTVDETDRLIRLVNDLLTLARADSRSAIPTESMPLQPILADVCQQAQQLGPQHKIICEPAGELTICGNPDALRQILLILLDNAITHTQPGCLITVSAAANDDDVEIRVSDSGPGIDAADLSHIFDRFYQGDTVRTGPGSGLGLSIANELAEAMGGAITASSILGQGSEFILSFSDNGE